MKGQPMSSFVVQARAANGSYRKVRSNRTSLHDALIAVGENIHRYSFADLKDQGLIVTHGAAGIVWASDHYDEAQWFIVYSRRQGTILGVSRGKPDVRALFKEHGEIVLLPTSRILSPTESFNHIPGVKK